MSQIQDLQRTQPVRRSGLTDPSWPPTDTLSMTMTLYAALRVATGQGHAIDRCNDGPCQPFAWTKPAGDIITSLDRRTDSGTEPSTMGLIRG
jgi:hypothetical protein